MALIGEMKYLTIGSNTYEIPTSELPIASSSTLGGIKVGTNLSIDSSTGVLSVTGIPTISITRNLTSGTKSATINVDGTDYDIYSTDDTKNTAGSTDDTTNSLYIIGATSQGANPQTYSNKNFHIRGSYLYLGYNGTTTVTGLCFYYGSYYATMVYGGAITGDTYTPILKFSSATPANGVVLRNIANPRNDEDAVNRGYLISALSNKVSDYSFKTEDNYKQVINLENYSGGFNISSTVYPDEEGTVVNATRWLNARFYDGALAIKAVDFTENNTSFNGYLAINKDEVNLGKINNNVVTSYIKIDNNGTTIKNVVTPTANTDAANKQYVDNAISNISYPVTSVNGNTGAVTLDVDKWNGVSLDKMVSDLSNQEAIIPFLWSSSDTTARFARVSKTPSNNCIAQYSNGYLNSTTPTSGDSSTKVATTAFVASAVSGISVPTASSTTPAMDGTAATGSETTFARGDHVHPTDTSRAATSTVTTQASIGSDGLITYKNSGNTSLYTVQLPLFDGESGASNLPFLPLAGGSLTGNLSVGGTTTSTGLITGNGGISTTTLTASGNTTVGGNLSVSGTTTSTGLLTANGGISTTALTTSGNTVVGGTLGVTEATTLGSTLGVTGATTLDSTLNVTGATTVENATVNGVLDVTPRRCYATLSQAGWYRVLKCQPNIAYYYTGTIIKFYISVYGSQSSAHEISLAVTRNDGAKFYGEHSANFQEYVEAIRATSDGTNLYVDIKWNRAAERDVTIYFEAFPGIDWQSYITAQSLQGVATSPSGETVLTEYSFAANTYGFEAATKDSAFSATTFNLNAYRRGDVFVYYYNIRVPALSAETEVTMGTFSSLAPPTALNQTAAGQEGGAYLLQFKTNGTVTIYSTNGAPVQFVRGTITIPVIH